MGRAPRFSVVIPAFNASATVASAVASVLSQSQPDLEVIVVDDGSTDNTMEVVKGINDRRVSLLTQHNRGPAAARNAGVAAARGEYVALLDSDDLYLPRYLELAERALDSAPDIGFAYTDAYVFDGLSGKVRQRSAMARSHPPSPPPEDRDGFLLELLRRNFVYVGAALPKRVLDAVGGFNESRTTAGTEDYELWLRILVAGHRAAWIPGQQALYRKHPGQASKQLVSMSRDLRSVYEDLSLEEMPSAAHRDLLLARRRQADREARTLSRLSWIIPQKLVTKLKRAGVGESWYEHPPAEVATAFPDLSAV